MCVRVCNPETSQRELLAALYLSASMMMNSEFIPDGGKNSVRFEGERAEFSASFVDLFLDVNMIPCLYRMCF